MVWVEKHVTEDVTFEVALKEEERHAKQKSKHRLT